MTVRCTKCNKSQHDACTGSGCECKCRRGYKHRPWPEITHVQFSEESNADFARTKELIKAYHAEQERKKVRVQEYRKNIVEAEPSFDSEAEAERYRLAVARINARKVAAL